MEVVNDGAAAQIKEILAHTSVAGASPLPSPNMGEGVFYGNPFTEPGASLRGLLTLSQL